MPRPQGLSAIITAILLFIVVHWGFAPEHHSSITTATTMLGGIAFILMTVSVILATRLEVLEEWFGGLDRMYQVHRVAGTLTGIFVVAHFVGVPKNLPEGVDPVLNPLNPSSPLGKVAMVLLVIGILISLNRKITYSKWRAPHKIMALVYFLTIGHFMKAPGVFFERFSASGIVLISFAEIGMIALIYTMLGMNRRTATPFKIEAVNPMERATEIVLEPVRDMLSFRPGQFAFVEIQGKGWSEPHPFTISSAPGEGRLRFTVKVLGDWTRKIREELKPGGDVIVRGPYGRFDASKVKNRNQVWIAGGIGVTPFLSKIRAMGADDDRQVHFVYATRSEAEALFLEELRSRTSELGNITLYPLFSDIGEFARVDIAKELLPGALDSFEYFICGPRPMVDGLIRDLKREGVHRSRIHTEAFEFR